MGGKKGEKTILASKYRAAKAGHISAKGNGRKKLMGRKENIGLQIPGSKSWTHISEKGIGGKITGASGGLKLR